MKALTLTQPWAQLMADGRKHVETRSWTTKHRGLLAIHAAKGYPPYAREFSSTELALGRLPPRIALGAIIAVVDLEAVEATENAAQELTALERYYGDYTAGRFAWFTKLIRKLDEPLGCGGHLGLWDVPSLLVEQMESQLP